MSASGENKNQNLEFRFECTRCGYCCTHEPGFVFLSRTDLDSLVTYFGLNEDQFLDKYCVTVHYGWETRISLTEKKNHDCIFWEAGKGCTVYPVRPIQCRIYPIWPSLIASKDSWDEEAKRCPGMNRGPAFSDKEIDERLMLRERNPFLSGR